jgi:hypothetical protein
MFKLKDMFKIKDEIKAYAIYFFDREKYAFEIHPLPSIKPVLHLKSYNERYSLDKVAGYLQGKPCFILLRGIPFSVEIEECSDLVNEEIDPNNPHKKMLRFKGYTASEIDAKIGSVYTNSVFRKGSLGFKDYVVMILTNVITGLTVYLITVLSRFSELQASNEIVNATVGVSP